MIFDQISSVSIEEDITWKDKVFLTFDIDWAPDFVIEQTLSLLGNIPATFFVTHDSFLINQLKKNHQFECGIHPNFNPLLEGDFRYGKNITAVLDYYLDIVPNAKSVRSHSMTQNSRILQCFTDKGLKYDCNHFIPYYINADLKPWTHWDNSLIKVPYFWEDDIQAIYDNSWKFKPKKLLRSKGIKVFDFHPIHVYLNTENLDRYQAAKPYLKDEKKLKEFINTKTYGTRDFLKELIKYEK